MSLNMHETQASQKRDDKNKIIKLREYIKNIFL